MTSKEEFDEWYNNTFAGEGYNEALAAHKRQQKKIDTLEQQRDELVEVLIDVYLKAEETLKWVKDTKGIESKQANEYQKYLQSVIIKITGKTWEQIRVGRE